MGRAPRWFTHKFFLRESGGRHFGRVLICMRSELSPEPAAAVGPFFVCGEYRPGRLIFAALGPHGTGTAWKLRFLPWIGGVSWPPAGPQPAPYPQKSREPLGVRPVSHAPSPFSYGFEPCPLGAYKAAFSAFAGVFPGAPRVNVLRSRLCRARVVSRLSMVRGVSPDLHARPGLSVVRCRQVDAKPAPARAVTSGGICKKYIKKPGFANYRAFNCCFLGNKCLYLVYKEAAAARSRVPRHPFLLASRFTRKMYFRPAKPAGQRWGGRDLFATASRLIVVIPPFTQL